MTTTPQVTTGREIDVPTGAGPVLLYDGVCNFCHATVRFVLERERRPVIQFAALQSAPGQALLEAHGVDPTTDSVVFIAEGRAHVRSAAAVRTLFHLRGAWPLLGALLWLVPWPLRDLGYASFARVRYRFFGRADTCMLPTPAIRARFLDAAPGAPRGATG